MMGLENVLNLNSILLLKNILFLVIGLCGGLLVAGGLFAFLALVGVITRLAAGTRTAKNLMLYEDPRKQASPSCSSGVAYSPATCCQKPP